MELLLIRHGLPETQRGAVPGAGVDPPLTARGRADAELLGRYLAALPGSAPDVVYTSPMRRAHETADAITMHGAVPLHVDDRLREFDHGAESYTPPELVTAEVQATLWQALRPASGACTASTTHLRLAELRGPSAASAARRFMQ